MQVQEIWERGERSPQVLRDSVASCIALYESARVDYIEVVSATSLQPFESICTEDTVVALAVRFGRTRLIDNAVLAMPE